MTRSLMLAQFIKTCTLLAATFAGMVFAVGAASAATAASERIDSQERGTEAYAPIQTHPCTQAAIRVSRPAWVADRQQYETRYVYAGPQADIVYVVVTESAPQWAADRQQYETSYVYAAARADAIESVASRPAPQWVADRQQYETSYVYAKPEAEILLVTAPNSEPNWVADRQQYETSYVYAGPQGDMLSTETVCTTDTEAAG